MLLTYPDVAYLSGCWLPIRVLVTYPGVGAGCGLWRCIWIGTAYLDRLLSYPDVAYLSGCWLPIRVMAESVASGSLLISLGSGLCC